MSELPPPPARPAQYLPPTRLDGCAIVRCDYGLSAPCTQPWGLTVTRDERSTWTLVKGRDVLLELHAEHVAWTRVTATETVTKRTPPWAVIVGLIGLLVFLIGILFFFIKEDVRTPTALVEIAGHDGRMVVLRIVGADGNILRTQLGAH